MGIVNYTYNRSTSGGEIITHLINSTDGTGLHFDGAAGNIDIATPPDLGTAFSFEFIVQADSWVTSTYKYLIDLFGSSPVGRFIIGSSNLPGAGLSIYDTTGFIPFNASPLEDLKVHHIVVTVDGTTAVLYDNGNQVSSITISASHGIDDCTDAFIGSDYLGTNQFFNGTFYRARFWNKTLTAPEVTASYENATVPFADQYGSQTVLIGVATGLDGWDANNTWNSQTTGGSNMILSATALNQYCRTNTTLGVGKKYRLTYTATGTTTAYFGGFWGGGYTNIHQISDGTRTVDFTFEFSQPFINDYFYCYAGGPTAGVTLSNLSLVEIGCAVDLDLAFANPTQSLMVQDRAGAADGTSSATGVVQVTPIEAVNTNKLNVGGVLPKVGIGLAAGSTPDRHLQINDSSEPDILLTRTAGATSGGLGNIYFGAQDGDKYLCHVGAAQDGAVDAGKLEFSTEATGGTRATRLTIDSAGKIEIGNNIPMWSGSYGGALVLKGNDATADRYAQLGIVDSNGTLVKDGLIVDTNGNVLVGTGSANLIAGARALTVGAGTTGDVVGSVELQGSRTTDAYFGAFSMFHKANRVVEIRGNRDGADDAGALTFHTMPTGGSITERLRIDSAGNAGLGVSPKSWYSGFTAMQLSDTGAIWCENIGGESSMAIGENSYLATDGAYKYLTTDEASSYIQSNGIHSFKVAVSGTADAAITWTDALTIDSAGNVTLPAQPAFNVNLSTSQNDIATGAWTTVLFNNERFDQGSNFNTGTYTFTAPVTGKYQLDVSLRLENVDAAAGYYEVRIATSNKDYKWLFDPRGLGSDPDYWPVSLSVLADMDTSDTSTVDIYQYGGTAQTDVNADQAAFSGFLAC